MKYYKATGYGAALDLAIALKDKALEYFNENGDYNSETFGGHTHSTTCVMSSLAQLAELTSDARLMGRVKAFYDNGLGEFSDPLGWVIENSGDEAPADRGEINNSGDILETALILGRLGYPEYYDDAERILRCHILPSNCATFHSLKIRPTPAAMTANGRVADRHLGAFGFPAPYGHHPIGTEYISFNMDIVGGGGGFPLRSIPGSGAYRQRGPPCQSPLRPRNALSENRVPLHASGAAGTRKTYRTPVGACPFLDRSVKDQRPGRE